MPVSECAIQQAIERNTPLKNWRDHFWTKDNRAFPVEISVTSLAGGAQRLFGGVFVFRDISEQVRLEQDMKRAAEHDQLSIGVSSVSAGDHIESWLQRADKGLYEAKKGGRNQVIVGS